MEVKIIQRELIYIWYFFDVQFRQIVGYWILGIVVGSFVSVFLKKYIHDRMASLQDRRFGVWGILPASALGILSPLCMYGTVPIAASFSKSGMREDWIATFMMSSILLNPQLFFYSFALGTEIAFLRLTVTFAGGCIAGMLVRLFFQNKPFYCFTDFELPGNRDLDANLMMRFLKNIWRNIKVTAPYFLFGVLLTALYQRYVPPAWIAELFGSNQGLGTLMAAALGVPLYTCGGGTIPLIAAWLGEGDEHGQRHGIYDSRFGNKADKLGCGKDYIRNTEFYLIFRIFNSHVCCIWLGN